VDDLLGRLGLAVLDVIRELKNKGTTILYTTNFMSEAESTVKNHVSESLAFS
jgi:ABC-type multidrug transport system ATPase subunit